MIDGDCREQILPEFDSRVIMNNFSAISLVSGRRFDRRRCSGLIVVAVH